MNQLSQKYGKRLIRMWRSHNAGAPHHRFWLLINPLQVWGFWRIRGERKVVLTVVLTSPLCVTWGCDPMGLLANLKLRRKLMGALAPLAVMVILAGLYASYESKHIDTLYRQAINNEVKALHNND